LKAVIAIAEEVVGMQSVRITGGGKL